MNLEALSITECRSEDAKRSGYLSWDEYFMSTAFLAAMRSKDPATQVGATIVNDKNRIVGKKKLWNETVAKFFKQKSS
jgi:deoxycytidylate deaminase